MNKICLNQCSHIKHMRERAWLKINFDKMTAMRTPNMVFMLRWSNLQFETLPIQCRHIEHLYNVVTLNICTKELRCFFDKMTAMRT